MGKGRKRGAGFAIGRGCGVVLPSLPKRRGGACGGRKKLKEI